MSPTGDFNVTVIFLGGWRSFELAQSIPDVALAWHNARGSIPLWVTGQTYQPLGTPLSSPSPGCWHRVARCLPQTHLPATMPAWPRNTTTAAWGATPPSSTGPHPGQSVPKQRRLWEWATSSCLQICGLSHLAHPAILHDAPPNRARHSTRLGPRTRARGH